MLNDRQAEPGHHDRPLLNGARLTSHLRLFGLLALLVPLFAGLQYIVREGVPRVEVRLIAQDVQTTVPVEVPVERVVERVVYVPVDRQTTVPTTEGLEPVRAIVPASPEVSTSPEVAKAPDVQLDDRAVAGEAGREPEVPAPVVAAEPGTDAPPLTGTIALAPPLAPVVAAPVVAVRPAPVPRYSAPPAEIVVADEGEAVADEGEIDSEIAEAGMPEAAPDDGQEVAEAADDAAEEVAVVQFVSEEPVIRGDGGASIAMLRHELSVRERKPEPEAVVEAVVDDPPAPAADEEPGPADEESPAEPEATEPEADEPVADGEVPVGEASPVSSEELLAQAESVKTEVLDHGSNNEQSLGVIEHQLVARPAGPRKAAESEGEQSEPADEGSPVAVAPETDEAVEAVASDDGGESADDETVGAVDRVSPDVARVEEEPAVEDEPEQ